MNDSDNKELGKSLTTPICVYPDMEHPNSFIVNIVKQRDPQCIIRNTEIFNKQSFKTELT